MKHNGDVHTPRHPIQVVVRRTGLSADVLRAWERRYAAVEPGRSPTNRRLYSDADLERLTLLRLATEGGRSIGQVAPLSREALRDLVGEDQQAAQAAPRRAAAAERESGDRVRECLGAIERFDAPGLRALLEQASVQMSQPKLIEELLVPLMVAVGEGWHDGALRISHEHLTTNTIEAFLGELTQTTYPIGAPSIVVAAPAGQRHQVGAMIVAAAAATEGWAVVYLGSDLPAEDIAAAVASTEARAVALSIIFPTDDPMLPGELARLRRLLPVEVALILGGRGLLGYRQATSALGAIEPPDLPAFRQTLADLRDGSRTTEHP